MLSLTSFFPCWIRHPTAVGGKRSESYKDEEGGPQEVVAHTLHHSTREAEVGGPHSQSYIVRGFSPKPKQIERQADRQKARKGGRKEGRRGGR